MFPVICVLLLLDGPVQVTSLAKLELSYEAPFAVGPGGVVCVGTQDAAVLFFDGEGKLLAQAGGQGEGPGEFQGIVSVRWSSLENCFILFDDMSYKLATYDLKGHFLKETNCQPVGDPRLPTLFCSASQRLYFSDEEPRSLVLDTIESNPSKSAKNLITLGAFEQTSSTKVKVKGNQIELFYLWDPTILADSYQELVAMAPNQKSTVKLVSHSGSLVATVSVPFKRQLVTGKDKETFLETFPPEFKKQLGDWSAPEMWPLMSRVLFDDQGNLWVLGQKEPSGYAYLKVDGKGKVMASGFVGSLPKVIAGGYHYGYRQHEGHYQLEKQRSP